jgi:hypothetical protein
MENRLKASERRFDKKWKCIDAACDNAGTSVGEDEAGVRPCQFCLQYRLPLRAFMRREQIAFALNALKDIGCHNADFAETLRALEGLSEESEAQQPSEGVAE